MANKSEFSDSIEKTSRKNRIELTEVNRPVSSDKEDDDHIILKLDEKIESDADFDTTKGTKTKLVERVKKIDLEEGEVISERTADTNVDCLSGKNKPNGRKLTKNSPNTEGSKTCGTSQKVPDQSLSKVRLVSNHIWVSNIHRNVKAADLKAFFGKISKVSKAKILTNGKHFYGYITMENEADASKCIRQLNNSEFEGHTIVVTKNRPDMRDAKVAVKKAEVTKIKVEKEDKKENKVSLSNISPGTSFMGTNTKEKQSDQENDPDVISISSDKISDTRDSAEPPMKLPGKIMAKSNDIRGRDDQFKKDKKERAPLTTLDARNSAYNVEQTRTINDLRKKMKLLFCENDNLKHKLDDYQQRYAAMRNRCTNLEKDLKRSRLENREDRQRFNEEKESFEKKKKSELARIEADRAAVLKELAENRKLKDQLKSKVEELRAANAKVSKRSRSPAPRNARSPFPMRSSSSSHFRGERQEKRPRYDEVSRVRTPSPPKYITDAGRKRNNENVQIFYSESVKRPSAVEHQFDYRRKTLVRPSEETAKNEWTGYFQKEPRRSNPIPAYSGNSRYGAGFPQTGSNISVPLRGPHNAHYFPQW
ncbi:uncharacterized protein [Leptinotarsa decemlineata]|uniref:uncharacterized protein n=1 Tax=Leptinotarsa decemlineata TaxID=7539 RepID=UPI003D30743A